MLEMPTGKLSTCPTNSYHMKDVLSYEGYMHVLKHMPLLVTPLPFALGIITVPRKVFKLGTGAYPCIFPNLPSYLSEAPSAAPRPAPSKRKRNRDEDLADESDQTVQKKSNSE